MKIVLLGAPGSGKGTQAAKIAAKYNIVHVSTGDIFRENIKNGTPLGQKVKSIIDRGELCPDKLTAELVTDRLSKKDCENGFLLDGFPRNAVQALDLEAFAEIDAAINIRIEKEKLVGRIIGRRSCPDCNGTFHITTLADEKKCPVCGGALFTRKDDNEETVVKRMEVYESQTAPLIRFYSERGKLRDVDGDRDIETVFNDVCNILNSL